MVKPVKPKSKMDIKSKLKRAHESEDELNRELAKQDAIIRNSERKKLSIARKISANMKYRNKLLKPPSNKCALPNGKLSQSS